MFTNNNFAPPPVFNVFNMVGWKQDVALPVGRQGFVDKLTMSAVSLNTLNKADATATEEGENRGRGDGITNGGWGQRGAFPTEGENRGRGGY